LCEYFLHVVALPPPLNIAGISPAAKLVNADGGRISRIDFSDQYKPC